MTPMTVLATADNLPTFTSFFSNTATAHGCQTSRQASTAAALATALLGRRRLLVLHGGLSLRGAVVLTLGRTVLSLRRTILTLRGAVLSLGRAVRLRDDHVSNCDQAWVNAPGNVQVGGAEGSHRRHHRRSNLEQTLR
jgi:hypothetical protein